MPRTILDVSRWQGSIDWDKDKKSGNSACSCGGDCGKCKGCH